MSCEFGSKVGLGTLIGLSEIGPYLCFFPIDTHGHPLLYTENSSIISSAFVRHTKAAVAVGGNNTEWKNEYEAKGSVAIRDLEPEAATRCAACLIPSNGAVLQLSLNATPLCPDPNNTSCGVATMHYNSI